MNKLELLSQMARHGDSRVALAGVLGISTTSLSQKMNAISDFRQGEIQKMIDRYHLTPDQTDLIFFTRTVSENETEESVS